LLDRSTARAIQPMGPSARRRSRSAFEARDTPRELPVLMHSARSRLSGRSTLCQAPASPLHWLGLPQYPSSRRHTHLFNPHTSSTPRWASVTRLGPNGDSPRLVSLTEVATRFGLARDTIHTLNACSYAPDALKFIILFESNDQIRGREGVIYAKTNLHLLPGHELPYPDQIHEQAKDEYDDCSDTYSVSDLIHLRSRAVSAASLRVEVSSTSSGIPTPPSFMHLNTISFPPAEGTATGDYPPIALFPQVRPGQQGRAFEFLGWYEIEETEFFAPRTIESFRMLGERTGWKSTPSKAGMECEWAKIKLVRQGGSESVRSEDLPQPVHWSRVFTRYS
jgi:hypothetical protein